MTWNARTPRWVKPTADEVDDFHWLGYRVHTEAGPEWVSGAVTAAAWVRGGRTAPVTERDEQPVTAALAEAELWAAVAAGPAGDGLPLTSIYTRLGVTPWPTQPVSRQWAEGAWRALRWLLGLQGQGPPLPLPVRNPDGTTPTRDELYAAQMALQPWRYSQPEQQQALRTRLHTDVRRSIELIALIDDTKRNLGVRV